MFVLSFIDIIEEETSAVQLFKVDRNRLEFFKESKHTFSYLSLKVGLHLEKQN